MSIRLHSILIMLVLTSTMAAQHVHTDRTGTRVLPLPKGDDVWHFVIYGDRTGGPAEGIKVLEQAVSDTNLLDPDLVMTVGDLVQGYNETPNWMEQMEEFRGVMSALSMPWFPVAGNHDTYWRGKGERPLNEHDDDYEKHFGPLWYWFEHKNSAFIVLYTDEGDPKTGVKDYKKQATLSPTQLEWLEKSLNDTARFDHVFCFLHHPRWLTDRYKGGNWDAVHGVLAAAGNVRAVFAGHIHSARYDGERDGIEYFTLATTGGSLSRELPRAGFLHHLNVVTVRKKRFSMAIIPVGAVIDPRSIDESRLSDMNALLNKKFAPRFLDEVVLGDRHIDTPLRFEVTNPAKRRIEATFLARSDSGAIYDPSHQHLEIEPGETVTITFRYSGEAGTSGTHEIEGRIDYLAPDARIELPVRTWIPPHRVGRGALGAKTAPGELILDGKAACVTVPSAALDLGQGSFTLECRVRAEALKGRRPLVTKTQQSDYGLFLDDGQARFMVHLDGKYCEARSDVKLETGQWYHIAGVYDGREVRLYVDGKKVAAVAGSGARKTNTLPLIVGADPDGEGKPVDHLKGRIDEVRLSTGTRYVGKQARVERRHEADTRTVLLLHLDQTIGRFTPDAGPHEAHGIVVKNARVAPPQ